MGDDAAEGVVHRGDEQRRVQVPLPKSLRELQFAAGRYFGQGGNEKLWHRGVTPVTHPYHVQQIQAGDVVIVGADKLSKDQQGPYPISTQQEHYVQHKLEPQVAKKPRGNGAELGKRFEGVSSYAQDFSPPPADQAKRVQQVRPKCAWGGPTAAEQDNGPTGKSVYTTAYPWREAQQQQKLKPPGCSIANDNAKFEACTSYQNDFVRHPQTARPKSAQSAAKKMNIVTEGKFDGESTYVNDFKSHGSPQTRQPSKIEGSLKMATGKFDGTSEYHHNYINREVEKRPMVWLEPEMSSRRDSNPRAQSAPGTGRRSPGERPKTAGERRPSGGESGRRPSGGESGRRPSGGESGRRPESGRRERSSAGERRPERSSGGERRK